GIVPAAWADSATPDARTSAVARTKHANTLTTEWSPTGCNPPPLLPQRSQRGPQLVGEELWFLPGGEVAAPLDLVEVDEGRVDLLDPAARGLEDLAGKDGEADRDRDLCRSMTDRGGCSSGVLPVHPHRGGPGSRQPVEGDVVEDVVSTEVARGLVVDEGAGDLVVGVGVVVEHPG